MFAGDALSHVAFVGAIAAAAVGVDERIGLFVLCLAVAAGLGAAGERARADDTVIGIAFAWVLGLGVLLLAVLATSAGGASGITTANTLFGSIYALSPGGAWLAATIAAAVTLAVLAGARPLLLSTLEPELAALRGVPVRLLGAGFLAALAAVTAESTAGGRRSAPARADRRSRGSCAGADRAAVCRPGPRRRAGRGRDVGRPRARLRDPGTPAEQCDHRAGRRHVRDLRARRPAPAHPRRPMSRGAARPLSGGLSRGA